MYKFGIILAIAISFMACFELEAKSFQTDRIRSGDTLEAIAERNLSKVKLKYGKDIKTYAEDIKKWNPQISTWNPPPVSKKIYVDYPFNEYILGATWAPNLDLESDSTEYSRQSSLNIFATSSIGSYSEKTNAQTVTSGQNFPYALGLAFSSSDDEREHFVLGSFYWAKGANGSVTNTNGTKSVIKTPGEIGGNFYYQNYSVFLALGMYLGYDYEKLNTFNTSEILIGSKLKNIENEIHYGTLGFVKGFTPFNLRMNLKASVSKTISSHASRGEDLTGYKYILNANYYPDNNLSFGVFYKHHLLKGTTDLSIDRFAFTVGFFIF
jgi:hypothetical protein